MSAYPPQTENIGKRARVTLSSGEVLVGTLTRRDDASDGLVVVQADDGRVLVSGDIAKLEFFDPSTRQKGYEVRYVVTANVTSGRELPTQVGEYMRQALRGVELPLAEGNVRVAGVEYLDLPPAPRARWSPLWWVADPEGRVALWRGLVGAEPTGWKTVGRFRIEDALAAHVDVLATQPYRLTEMGLAEDELSRNWNISRRGDSWVWAEPLDGFEYLVPVTPGVPIIPIEVITAETARAQEGFDGGWPPP